MEQWKLIVTTPGGERAVTLFEEGAAVTGLSIGSGEDSDVRITDADVAETQAYLLLRSGVWSLIDAGAPEGVTVNGVRLSPGTPVSIYPGDVARMGRAELALVCAAPARAEAPAQSPEAGPRSLPLEYKPLNPWVMWLYRLLFGVPVVGFICLIVFSVGGARNRNLRNYARSYWCEALVAFVLLVVLGLVAYYGGYVDRFTEFMDSVPDLASFAEFAGVI